MLHTKFRENRPAGSGEEYFWCNSYKMFLEKVFCVVNCILLLFIYM